VRLSVDETTAWAEDFYVRAGYPFNKDVPWASIARDAKFSTSKLRVQRKRNEIDALILINVSRTYGMNPLAELARIPRWQYLASIISMPSTRQILSSLNPRHILYEIGDRLGIDLPRHIELEPWISYYARFSIWFDVTGGEAAKNRLAEILQLSSPTSMNARLNSRIRFEVDDILDGFVSAGMDPIYALVLAGWITDTEAGYAQTLRRQSLISAHIDELLFIMQKQMRSTLRLLASQ